MVHHANGDPLDNSPSNLKVLCSRHHVLVHRGGFDLDNPDYSRYYVGKDGTLYRKAAYKGVR